MSYYSKYLESCVASTLHLLSNQAKIKQLGFSIINECTPFSFEKISRYSWYQYELELLLVHMKWWKADKKKAGTVLQSTSIFYRDSVDLLHPASSQTNSPVIVKFYMMYAMMVAGKQILIYLIFEVLISFLRLYS